MKRLYVFVLVLTGLLVGSCKPESKVRIIKMGHAQVTAHPVHNAMVYLAERLEEKSNGRIKVKVYPNQQLGSERELLELLQIKTVRSFHVNSM